jgi:hypothetical protein
VRRLQQLALALALVSLVACGGGDDDDDDGAAEVTTTTEAETTTTVDSAADEAAAGQVAVDFFAAFAAQDADAAALLMENGEAHKPKILHCANLSTAFTGIELVSVVLDDPETATLTYDILGPDGAPLVEGSQGKAFKVDGSWIFAETAFLSLYDAAKDGCTGPVPPEE